MRFISISESIGSICGSTDEIFYILLIDMYLGVYDGIWNCLSYSSSTLKMILVSTAKDYRSIMGTSRHCSKMSMLSMYAYLCIKMITIVSMLLLFIVLCINVNDCNVSGCYLDVLFFVCYIISLYFIGIIIIGSSSLIFYCLFYWYSSSWFRIN